MTSLVSSKVESQTFAAGLQFVDWLVKSKQSAWQILPLHQTELQKGSKDIHVPSPYKGYGIGLDPQFLTRDAPTPDVEILADYIKVNNYWLKTYALFCALRDHFGTDDWSQWPEDIRNHKTSAVKSWQKKLLLQITTQMLIQNQLHLSYQNLKNYARKNNIVLIGDMPFYIGMKSPLVWKYQHLFDLTKDRKMERVSGVLKGIESHYGRQVWGHPLYKWNDYKLLPELYTLFKIRIKYLASLFDWVRLDHAKGLFTYGVIDGVNRNLDIYLEGPGRKFLEKIIKFSRLQKLKIYAEDTGDKLIELRKCLHAHHLPGIKIFRFAYNEKKDIYIDQYLKISKYPVNTFAYTTTHDTEPLVAYLENLTNTQRENLKKKLRIKKTATIKEFAIYIREKIIKSPAKIVLIPLQDWLLTTERINTPGTEIARNDTNWSYKMSSPIEDLPVDLF